MDLKVQPTKLRRGIVDFIDDVEVVKLDGIIYPMVYSVSGIKNLYSLPHNDKYKPYTKKKNVNLNKVHDKQSVLKYWTPYKKGSAVFGIVIDNKFNIH